MVSRLKVISRIFVLGANATERGKMDPSLNRSWENERTQNLGAQALENMPSFSEHMQNREEASREKLFSELSASERPAGVRDEQDYREYLAEMRAKQAESLSANEKIINGIKDINREDDRDFLASMLPYFAEKTSGEDIADGFTIKDSAVDLFEFALASSKSNSNNPDFSLSNHIENVLGEFMSGSSYVREGSMDYFILHRYPALKKGQEIESFSDTPEGTTFEFSKEVDGVNAYFGEVNIANSTEGVATKKIGHRVLGVSEEGDTIALLALGKDLISNKDEIKTPSDEWKRNTKIRMIQDIFNNSYRSIEDSVQEIIKNTASRVMYGAAEKMHDPGFIPSRESSVNVPFDDLGRLVVANELRNDIKRYEIYHSNYLADLSKGRKLLNAK